MAHYSINRGKQKIELMLEKILHIQTLEKKINKALIVLAPNEQNKVLPLAPYTLSKKEKKMFCETLQSVKVPDGYCSNFRNIVSMDDCRLHGLKSHDCHTLMQQLLPLAIRNCLPQNVRSVIIRLCLFFNSLCSKVVEPNSLDQLQKELTITLYNLEQSFLPAFFDIMVHLTVHLVEEVRLCGPVYLRWMYPFEREMKPIKGYVRNRYRPEGCIAECYIAEEALEFCTEYLSNCNSIGLPTGCLIDFTVERPLGGANIKVVDGPTLAQAHRCVLVNTPEIQPYIEYVTENLNLFFVNFFQFY